MSSKTKLVLWLIAGFCFLVASVCYAKDNNWLGTVQIFISILSFINAYQVKRKI